MKNIFTLVVLLALTVLAGCASGDIAPDMRSDRNQVACANGGMVVAKSTNGGSRIRSGSDQRQWRCSPHGTPIGQF